MPRAQRMVLVSVALVVVAAACGPDLRDTVDREALQAVVAAAMVPFEGDAAPDSVVAALAGHRVVLIGEYHGITRHDELVGELVVGLRPEGLSSVLLEFPQAHSWLLDGYARGGLDVLLEGAERTYGPLLRRVREMNASLAPDERVAVHAIDVNAHPQDFLGPFRGLIRQIGEPSVLLAFLDDIDAGGDHEEALVALLQEVRRERDAYGDAWGPRAYREIEAMLAAELRSAEVRREPSGAARDRAREVVMQELVDARLATARGQALVNVGYFHAQKTSRVGTVDTWLGEYLVARSPHAREATIVVVVVPASGEKEIRGRVRSFDLQSESPTNELFGVVRSLADDRIAFLPLDAPLFRERRVAVNFLPEIAAVRPKELFDAFLIVPDVEPIGR